MRDLYFRNGDGYMLVYSVTSLVTLKEVEDMWETHSAQLKRSYGSEHLPVVLVGNKIDLLEERTISTLKGQDLGARWKIPFVETSARTRINVDEAFGALVKRVMENDRKSVELKRAGALQRRRKCLVM